MGKQNTKKHHPNKKQIQAPELFEENYWIISPQIGVNIKHI